MRMMLAALACGVALTSSAHAYSLNDFLGTWYGENEVVPAGERRVVPVRIEITEIPPSVLGAPRRFRVHLWIRCMDRPREVCDLGAWDVMPNNDYQMPISRVSRHASALEFCRFDMVLNSRLVPGRAPKNALSYSVGPGHANCRRSEYTGISDSGGFVYRTRPVPALELPPGAVPGRPELPQPTPRGRRRPYSPRRIHRLAQADILLGLIWRIKRLAWARLRSLTRGGRAGLRGRIFG